MRQAILREWIVFLNDPWLLALSSYIPIISILVLWGIFSAAIPRQLPVAVIDQDQSLLSRQLVRYIDANPSTSVTYFHTLPLATNALRNGDVFALLTIPKNVQSDLTNGKKVVLDMRYNGQFLLVGKLVSSAISQSLAASLMTAASNKQRYKGIPEVQINHQLTPVQQQIIPLFNSNNNYVAFLVPPILIALFQILAMLIFVNSLNRELYDAHYSTWLQQSMVINLLAKVVVYSPVAFLQGLCIMSFLLGYLRVPINGSLAALLLAQCMMLLALWLLVMAIFFIFQDATTVVSLNTALLAPAFAFMGVTFPVDNMPWLARIWRTFMPSSHYMDNYLAVVSYGRGLPYILGDCLSYSGFLILVPVIGLAIFRLRKKMRQCPSYVESNL